MDHAVTFGDVFQYIGDEYVYFAEDVEEDIVFAGKILLPPETSRLVAVEKGRQAKNLPEQLSPIYSYIVLSTSEFKRRAVLCAYGIESVRQVRRPHASLDMDDRERIKTEIMEGPAPIRLKELVRLLA